MKYFQNLVFLKNIAFSVFCNFLVTQYLATHTHFIKNMQKHFVHKKFQIDRQIDHFIVGNEKPILM
jgi:hypothetical protein